MRSKSKKRAIAAGLSALVAITGGAYAYWTITGAGTGSAAAGDVAAVTVNQTGAAITGLYPGASQSLSGNFDNPNPGRVHVASVTAEVKPFSVRPDESKPACTAADFEITGTSNTPGQIDAGNAKGSWSGLSIAMKNASTNQDNCKNLSASTLKIEYTANAG